MAGSLLFLTQLETRPGYVSGVLIPGQLVGIAAGLGFAQLVGATMRDVGPNRYGMAGAGRTTVFQLATAMAIALGFVLVGEPSGPDDALDAYQRVAMLGAISYGVQALLFGLAYPRRSDHSSTADS